MRRFMTLLGSFILLTSPALAADRIMLVAGGGTEEGKSPALKAKLAMPFGVDFDKAGNLYFVEMTGQRAGKIRDGIVTTFAGTGKKGTGGDGGPATAAEVNGMHSLVVSPDGDVYLADTWNNRIRKVDGKTGTITAFAGTGEKGFSGDGGPASKAKFGGVYCLALDSRGEHLYIADLDNRRIRTIEVKTGIVSTVAGNGKKGVPVDGAIATEAPLLDPRAVAVDARANIYILERSGHVLRKVDPDGKITTVAGTGRGAMGGDGGPALKASMNGPKHLCIDHDGGVLIADTENHIIRKYLPAEGKMVRIAGTGKKGTAGLGGPPELAELNQPHGVFVHPNGDIYISDSSNNRILKIERGK
jgi:DNA-binding beta-propeller fold protein YncE